MNPRSFLSRWLVITLCGTLAAPVGAAETICDPEAPEKCARPILAGEMAPFSGQLLSTQLSLDLGLKANFCDDRLALEMKFQRKFSDLALELERRSRENDRKAWEESQKFLLKRLEEVQDRHWFEHPAIVTGFAVVLTVLVFIGARESLKKLD